MYVCLLHRFMLLTNLEVPPSFHSNFELRWRLVSRLCTLHSSGSQVDTGHSLDTVYVSTLRLYAYEHIR